MSLHPFKVIMLHVLHDQDKPKRSKMNFDPILGAIAVVVVVFVIAEACRFISERLNG